MTTIACFRRCSAGCSTLLRDEPHDQHQLAGVKCVGLLFKYLERSARLLMDAFLHLLLNLRWNSERYWRWRRSAVWFVHQRWVYGEQNEWQVVMKCAVVVFKPTRRLDAVQTWLGAVLSLSRDCGPVCVSLWQTMTVVPFITACIVTRFYYERTVTMALRRCHVYYAWPEPHF